MTTLTDEITGVKNELNKVLNDLSDIAVDNIESKLNSIGESINLLDGKRNKLREKYPEEELKKYNVELDLVIKEIINKFDDIINENKSEQNKLGTELKNMLNKKKLANYR